MPVPIRENSESTAPLRLVFRAIGHFWHAGVPLLALRAISGAPTRVTADRAKTGLETR
jgi:hypothetical protein